MRIFIIGGTGFISSRLTHFLLEAGHQLTIFTRGQTSRPLPKTDRLEIVHGDRTHAASLRSAVGNRTFDVVYDMIAYDPGESSDAVRIFHGKTGQFIHCSTISVYMVSDSVQTPITEDQDQKPVMPYFPRNPFGMDYGINKRGCEEVLWQEHNDRNFPVSMVRPTYVSGPEDPTIRDFFWVERILDGRPLLIPGSGDFAFQQVFVDDVARVFATMAGNDVTFGKAYNVASEEIFTLNTYLQNLESLLGIKALHVHVDQEIFDLLPFSTSSGGDVFPFNTQTPAIFSLERIKKDLGYHSTPYLAWMNETINWYKNYPGHSHGYQLRHEEVSFAQFWKDKRQNFLDENAARAKSWKSEPWIVTGSRTGLKPGNTS